MSLLYIDLIPAAERLAFEAKVIQVASELATRPEYLMQVMKAESRLRADIENTAFPFKNGYATGLIQFTPDTAASLGTSTEALKKMTRVQQMDWVRKYFLPWKGRLHSYFAVYLVVFFPAAVAHVDNDNYVFETKTLSRASIAKSNPAIDINKNGVITMAEFKQYVKNTVPKANWKVLFKKKN